MPEVDFLVELERRDLLYQRTAGAPLDRHLAAAPRVAYAGFDPTAPGLTIGNLVPIQLLVHWQRAGHKPLVLLGGGTGLIGDPSGKDSERSLLSREQIAANAAAQRGIFERLLDFDPRRPNAAEIVDNADWLGPLRYLDVLRDIGKHFSVNAMIRRDAVRERLETRTWGISYTEFSYALLQAYDFMHLYREKQCTAQLAGADQYGNLVAGIDLIRRRLGPEAEAYGVTAPLLTHEDGTKIGKTERGAIWLSADQTSPYAFYQYWMNLSDRDAIPFARRFSLLAREEIGALAAAQREAPEGRPAQRALARHMTERLHGVTEAERAEAASRVLFDGGDLRQLPARSLAEIFADVPHSEHPRSALDGGCDLVTLVAGTPLASSKREARDFLQRRAIWVNGARVESDRRLGPDDLMPGGLILLRRGKKRWHATRWRDGTGEGGADS